MTSLLAEAAHRRQQSETEAERASLKADAWYIPLSQVTGKVDDADGLEHVTMGEVFDFLRVPSKRREARLHTRIVEIMRAFRWSPINDRTKGKAAVIVRGFERKPAPKTSTSETSARTPEPAVVIAASEPVVPAEDTITLRGASVPLDREIGQQFVVDCSRVAEGVADAAAIQFKYELTPQAWQELMADMTLDRHIRRESERRIRNGSAAMELAQVNMPTAQKTLREILNDPKASPGYRVAAAKETREAASAARQQPGANEKFSITINFGSAVKPVQLEVQDPQPKVDTHRMLDYGERLPEAVPTGTDGDAERYWTRADE
jgi:hypothetical protein